MAQRSHNLSRLLDEPEVDASRVRQMTREHLRNFKNRLDLSAQRMNRGGLELNRRDWLGSSPSEETRK